MKILMVCKGNICRSPLAEGILQNLSDTNGRHWKVDSAAITEYHIGKAPDPRAIHTAKLNNLDISKQTCRLLSMEDFNTFDIVYAMSDDILDFMIKMGPNEIQHKIKLLLSEVKNIENKNVPDPFYGQQKDFDLAYKLILSACQSIIKKY